MKVKKKENNTVKRLSEKYRNSNKASIRVYIIIRAVIVAIMIRQIFGNTAQRVYKQEEK